MGEYAAAQDLAQETFLRAYRNLGSLREPARFGAWVVGIATQVCREKRRSRRRDRHRFVGARLADEGANPRVEEQLQAAEEEELVLRRLAELPRRERLAIHAFYLRGRSIEETASLVGLSRSGAYALLSRGCRRLAQRLRGGQKREND